MSNRAIDHVVLTINPGETLDSVAQRVVDSLVINNKRVSLIYCNSQNTIGRIVITKTYLLSRDGEMYSVHDSAGMYETVDNLLEVYCVVVRLLQGITRGVTPSGCRQEDLT